MGVRGLRSDESLRGRGESERAAELDAPPAPAVANAPCEEESPLGTGTREDGRMVIRMGGAGEEAEAAEPDAGGVALLVEPTAMLSSFGVTRADTTGEAAAEEVALGAASADWSE